MDISSSSSLNVNGKRPLEPSSTHMNLVPTPTSLMSTSGTSSGTTSSVSPILPVLQRTDKNGDPLSEKKLRRLEKNRLSARECRRRKREAAENLQREINLMEGENLRLRLQLQVGEEAEESTQQEQQRLTEALDGLLKSGASEAEIFEKIEEYKEKFADYGRDRRSAIEFHLRNIERLLMPTQTTSVIMATLNMGASTSAGNSSHGTNNNNNSSDTPPPPQQQQAPTLDTVPATATEDLDENAAMTSQAPGAPPPSAKSLFQHLVKILEVSPEQSAALKDSRFVAQEMDECLKTSLTVLAELRTRLTQCGEDLESEFNTVRSILTPTQAAKFLVWVANNKACMHMLNELWNRVYPQDQFEEISLVRSRSADEGEASPTSTSDSM